MKEEFEIEKLKLEITELRKPWWSRTNFISALVAASASLVLAYFTGWFDVNLTRLKNERFQLEQDINKFNAEKTELQNANNELTAQNREISSRLTTAQQEQVKLQKLVAELTKRSVSYAKNITEFANTSAKTRERQITQLKSELETASTANLDTKEIEEVLTAAESSLFDLQSEEDRVKQELRESGVLDEDGCFVDQDGLQNCTNF